MPTLYLSNWGGHATPGAHGPGRKLTIMARPRQWERGEGSVPLLVPDPDLLLDVKEERISHDEYREKFTHLVAFRIRRKSMGIKPGELLVVSTTGTGPVQDGDSLLCACGVEKARKGHCHRVVAGAFLAIAGWTVILDQEEMSLGQARKLLTGGVT